MHQGSVPSSYLFALVMIEPTRHIYLIINKTSLKVNKKSTKTTKILQWKQLKRKKNHTLSVIVQILSQLIHILKISKLLNIGICLSQRAALKIAHFSISDHELVLSSRILFLLSSPIVHSIAAAKIFQNPDASLVLEKRYKLVEKLLRKPKMLSGRSSLNLNLTHKQFQIFWMTGQEQKTWSWSSAFISQT